MSTAFAITIDGAGVDLASVGGPGRTFVLDKPADNTLIVGLQFSNNNTDYEQAVLIPPETVLTDFKGWRYVRARTMQGDPTGANLRVSASGPSLTSNNVAVPATPSAGATTDLSAQGSRRYFQVGGGAADDVCYLEGSTNGTNWGQIAGAFWTGAAFAFEFWADVRYVRVVRASGSGGALTAVLTTLPVEGAVVILPDGTALTFGPVNAGDVLMRAQVPDNPNRIIGAFPLTGYIGASGSQDVPSANTTLAYTQAFNVFLNTSGGPLTLVSTPSISGADFSQAPRYALTVFQNFSNQPVTIQDESVLPGSGVVCLNGTSVTINQDQAVLFYWDVSNAVWRQMTEPVSSSSSGSAVQTVTRTISQADLNALAAGVKSADFNVGSALPAGAIFMGGGFTATALIDLTGSPTVTMSAGNNAGSLDNLMGDVDVDVGSGDVPANTPMFFGNSAFPAASAFPGSPVLSAGGQFGVKIDGGGTDLNTATAGTIVIYMYYIVP